MGEGKEMIIYKQMGIRTAIRLLPEMLELGKPLEKACKTLKSF